MGYYGRIAHKHRIQIISWQIFCAVFVVFCINFHDILFTNKIYRIEQMADISYEIIQGHRSDSWLLWSPQEKLLYSKKRVGSNGMEDWICYQDMIRKKQPDATSCTCRLLVDRSKPTCSRKSIEHTSHMNHQLIYDDLMSRNKIIKDCSDFNALTKGLSLQVPAQDFFTRELAK